MLPDTRLHLDDGDGVEDQDQDHDDEHQVLDHVAHGAVLAPKPVADHVAPLGRKHVILRDDTAKVGR